MSEEHGLQNRALIALLHYGTWAACGVVALGMGLQAVPGLTAAGTGTVILGILAFILLPVCRVALMLAGFARERDYRFAAIAAAVLLVIAVSVWVGATRHQAPEGGRPERGPNSDSSSRRAASS